MFDFDIPNGLYTSLSPFPSLPSSSEKKPPTQKPLAVECPSVWLACLRAWLLVCLFGWLVGCLFAWLVACLVAWFACVLGCLVACSLTRSLRKLRDNHPKTEQNKQHKAHPPIIPRPRKPGATKKGAGAKPQACSNRRSLSKHGLSSSPPRLPFDPKATLLATAVLTYYPR